MSIIKEWAAAWGVSPLAMADLAARYVTVCKQPLDTDSPLNSETRVSSELRLAAPHNGMILWRNNVGALQDKNGRPVRYGLANDSKALNERIKSADLIGIRKVLITPQMVGQVFGQFASVEAKKRTWQEGEDKEREAAQKEWANLVLSWGGYAQITNTCDSIATSINQLGPKPWQAKLPPLPKP